MFSIDDGRLFCEGVPTKADFEAIAARIGVVPGYARKAGDRPQAAMRIVDTIEHVETINTKDGSVQARSTACPGDAVMTRLERDGSVKLGVTGEPDRWVVRAENLEKLYTRLGPQTVHGEVVGAQNVGFFVELPRGGDIEAPWGGRQHTTDGVIFYSEVTGSVYLNEADGFASFVVERPAMPIAAEERVLT